jgi:hypothetical protein
MTSNQKLLLLLLGTAAAFLMVAQLALGQILLAGGGDMRARLLKTHQHTGYTTVAVVLAYVVVSLWLVVNSPTRPKSGG